MLLLPRTAFSVSRVPSPAKINQELSLWSRFKWDKVCIAGRGSKCSPPGLIPVILLHPLTFKMLYYDRSNYVLAFILWFLFLVLHIVFLFFLMEKVKIIQFSPRCLSPSDSIFWLPCCLSPSKHGKYRKALAFHKEVWPKDQNHKESRVHV